MVQEIKLINKKQDQMIGNITRDRQSLLSELDFIKNFCYKKMDRSNDRNNRPQNRSYNNTSRGSNFSRSRGPNHRNSLQNRNNPYQSRNNSYQSRNNSYQSRNNSHQSTNNFFHGGYNSRPPSYEIKRGGDPNRN